MAFSSSSIRSAFLLLLALTHPLGQAAGEVDAKLSRGRCQTFLTYQKASNSFHLKEGWERIFAPLSLSGRDLELGRHIGTYYAAAFKEWSLGLSSAQLRHPYLTDQATKLLGSLDLMIDQYQPLVDEHARIMRGELSGYEANVAEQKSLVLAQQSFIPYRRAVNSLSHARVEAQKEFDESLRRIDELWRSLRELRETMASVLAPRGGPTLLTVLQFQIVTAMFATEVEVLAGGPDRGHSLRREFGVNLLFDQPDLRRWFGKIRRDPVTIPDFPVLAGAIRRRLLVADHLGNVTVPVGEPLPFTVKLGLGFLPIEFVTVADPDNAWTTHPIWRTTPERMPVPKLPSVRAKEISDSWNVWYLMLGGQLREADAIHQPTSKRRQTESLIHAILQVLRYAGYFAHGHSWSSAAETLEALYGRTLLNFRSRHPRASNGLTSYVTLQLHNDLREASGREASGFGADEPTPNEIAEALDYLIARIYAHPKLHGYSGRLSHILDRHPMDPLRFKLSELEEQDSEAHNQIAN